LAGSTSGLRHWEVTELISLQMGKRRSRRGGEVRGKLLRGTAGKDYRMQG
jgi:hypothetical protein